MIRKLWKQEIRQCLKNLPVLKVEDYLQTLDGYEESRKERKHRIKTINYIASQLARYCCYWYKAVPTGSGIEHSSANSLSIMSLSFKERGKISKFLHYS